MANESLTILQCEVFRRLAEIQDFWALPFERRREVFVEFFKTCEAIRTLGRLPEVQDYRGILLCETLYREENEWLAAEYFGGQNLFGKWYESKLSEQLEKSANLACFTIGWSDIFEAFYRTLYSVKSTMERATVNRL
jgi:hypothetical protein